MTHAGPALQAAPPGKTDSKAETKAEKFTRLAEARVTRALDDIRLVTQLSARTYHHTGEQAEQIVKVLAEAVSQCATSFSVPISQKIGPVGKSPTTPGIFADPKLPVHAEVARHKVQIAKALDFLNQDNLDEAKAVLVDLL